MAPAIGVTIGYDERAPERHVLRQDYVKSVSRAGGLPFVLAGEPTHAPQLLDRVQGLVLSGGSDVDPALYGDTPHPKLGAVIRERDDFELALVREALERDLPILAICRGHQVLNVATGGTLIQDIPSQLRGGVDHDPNAERSARVHDVRVLEGSRLRRILRQENVGVNSFHHQAIRDLGRGLVVSAQTVGDPVIEGVEMPERRFVVGVQWHPESFWREPEGFAPLFAALVEESRR